MKKKREPTTNGIEILKRYREDDPELEKLYQEELKKDKYRKIIFVDIDGTLINDLGLPIINITDKIQKHIDNEDIIIAWSAGEDIYAFNEFKRIMNHEPDEGLNKMENYGIITQPDICYDDEPKSVEIQAKKYNWNLDEIEIMQPMRKVD